MSDPCATCGGEHAGDCPQSEGIATATALPAEACAFCGERHPRQFKCGEWAQKVGTATESPWGASGFATMPDRPPLVLQPPKERGQTSRSTQQILKGCEALLALVGAVALVLFAVGHIGSGSATSASLPDCSRDRITANMTRASTILAEERPLPLRIDETHNLLLHSSASCSPQLLQLYISFIDYEALCLAAQKTDACPNRDSARVQLAQALANPEQ